MKQRFRSPKIPSADVLVQFDFTDALDPGESIVAVLNVEVRVSRGTDAAPSNILNGTPQVSVPNSIVAVPVRDGLAGVDYDIEVHVSTTNSLKRPSMIGVLEVRQ